ncbi:alpha/beta hydrolase [Azorhizobium sp. AG788]|uniref:alpha/beta fold hydrolase n=1 Tax=Azorhizobium sp. AG788 TaxID=2183897 RepID=UPI003138A117
MSRFRRARRIAACVVAVLVVLTLAHAYLAQAAERDYPPTGLFLTVDGVHLHYTEEGEGPVLVLLHGNGAMVEDFALSGLVERAAQSFRVISFDRPGFGHSTRPRGVEWTPTAQARLISEALARMGVTQAIVLGHSWGALVAVTLALDNPRLVQGLVLEAGYFFQSPRLDARMVRLVAQPGLEDVFSYTLTPLMARLLWTPIMDDVFGPDAVPAQFARFPKALALRPSQLRAATEEVALLNSGAAALEGRLGRLALPVAIVVGDGDRLIDPQSQSIRLHQTLPQSSLRVIPGGGHMVHQTALDDVMAAIDEVDQSVRPDPGPGLSPPSGALRRGVPTPAPWPLAR